MDCVLRFIRIIIPLSVIIIKSISSSSDNEHKEEEEEDNDDNDDNDNENDNDNDNVLHYKELKRMPLLRECILRDDGRTVEQFAASDRYIHQANTYFLMMMAQGEISNFLTGKENSSELVYIRVGNALLMLNEPNSRCYREMMKWKYSCMFSVCYYQCNHSREILFPISTTLVYQ